MRSTLEKRNWRFLYRTRPKSEATLTYILKNNYSYMNTEELANSAEVTVVTIL